MTRFGRHALFRWALFIFLFLVIIMKCTLSGKIRNFSIEMGKFEFLVLGIIALVFILFENLNLSDLFIEFLRNVL